MWKLQTSMTQTFYLIEDIAEVLKTKGVRVASPNLTIDSLAYDSRRINRPKQSLFFALKGLRDGHQFIAAAYRAGVRNFVVTPNGFTQFVEESMQESANFILVEDTLKALQALAGWHRRQFTYPVWAITGSNGKTVVKDWLYELLSPEFRIVRSPKSYNSQIGTALSLWQMTEGYDLALFEAGISRSGEMERLATMIRPQMSVLTNIGAAHQEGFSTTDEKHAEKWRLLAAADERLYPVQKGRGTPKETDWTWGEGSDARLQICSVSSNDPEPGWTQVTAKLRGEDEPRRLAIPFTDRASIENAIICWVAMLSLHYEQEVIAARIRQLQVMEMRLELKQGKNHSTIIDDSYSNDLSSLAISLDLLSQQQQHPVRTLILSDLPEVTGHEEQTYQKVAELLRAHQLDQLITVGPALAARKGQFPVAQHLVFQNTQELLWALPGLALADRSILIKGARKHTFELISGRLVLQTHETALEIDMAAISHNIQQVKKVLAPGVKMMAMVKAFSYGVGSHEVASWLQFHGVDYLAVAYADEGVALRQSGITLPIMVMSPDPSAFDAMVQHDLEPEIFSFSILEAWLDRLRYRQVRETWPIHLKFDTGMHRLGFQPEEAHDLGALLAQESRVRMASVFSHLAASGNKDHDAYTRLQHERFDFLCQALRQHVKEPFTRHLANTDAIFRYPHLHYDMVRLGIGLYGIGEVGQVAGRASDLAEPPKALRPCMRLVSRVSQVRNLEVGETVGYGRLGVLDRPSRIATVNIGYADGYNRRFGQGVGRMRIRGQSAPTVGAICMDMTMLDVTDIPDVQVGDQVDVYADFSEAADWIGTIPYELLVNISQRVKRLYYYH